MRYAVLGSNCFSASWLIAELLGRGDEVFGISRSKMRDDLYLPYEKDHPRFSFHQADVRDTSRLVRVIRSFQPDYVVNYAAQSEVFQSLRTPTEFYTTNTLAVVRLAEKLAEMRGLRRYVHISTAEVYGTCFKGVKEGEPLRPSTPYAVSKAAADMHLLALHLHFNLPVTVIRSTNVYGNCQQLYKLIPRAIIRLRQGQKVELHHEGRVYRTFVHIRDVVRGINLAMEHDCAGEVFNFSTTARTTVADVVRMVCKLTGYDFEKCTESVPGRTHQDQAYFLDCFKADYMLGWQPSVDLEDGIREVISWIDTNWDRVLKEPLEYVHHD